jgi:hypothetical protein
LLVTALVAIGVGAAVPASPASGLATPDEALGRPAPADSVSRTDGAGTTVVAIADGRHAALLSRPSPAESLAARERRTGDASRPETAIPAAAEGFDWVAAGSGIAIGFGVAALAGFAVLVGRRRTLDTA